MILSDFNTKFNDIMNRIATSLEKEGVTGFFNGPDCIKEHLGITEHDVFELNNESAVYCQNKDYKPAIECLGWLHFLEPLNASHLLRLGSVLLQTGEHLQAINFLKTGSLLDPENPEFFLYIGSCFLSLGEKDLAKEAFTTCVDLSKNDSNHKNIFLLAQQANFI